MRGAAVLTVSAVSGAGLPEVHAALIGLRDRVVSDRAVAAAAQGSRLAIDRVFSIRGRGTVVTGTLRGDPIARGAVLRVVPGPPGAEVRVREVQVHGRTVDVAGPGRVALNLAGGDARGRLDRGTVLTTDPRVVATDRALVALRPALGFDASGGRRLSLPPDRAGAIVHAGTSRATGVLSRAGRDRVDLEGGGGTAILRIERPVALAPGDRLALRRPSPAETLGGGRVLDAQPARGVARRRATPERLRSIAVADPATSAWSDARLDLHGAAPALGPGPDAANRWHLAPDVAAAVDTALMAALEAPGELRSGDLLRLGAGELRRRVGPLAGLGRSAADAAAARMVGERIDALVAAGRLSREADRVRIPGRPPADEPSPALVASMDRLVDALSSVAPPSLTTAARDAGCPPEGILRLERANRIVRLDDDLAWAFPTYRDLAGRAVAMASAAPLTPAAYRDATGTSRKYVMAILEDLDRRAILRRTPAGHVPGPRAPTLAAPAGSGG